MSLIEQLPLNALRAFEAAGRHDSFRAAADELGVSQGTVAQHVRGLEDRLAIALFERHPRGVRLTLSGARMHERLTKAFRGMEDAVAELNVKDGPVRLAAPGDLAVGWLQPLKERLAAAHPGLSLSVVTCGDNDADLEIEEGHDMDRPNPARPARRLFGSDIVAVAAPGVLSARTRFEEVRLLHDPRDLWPEFVSQVLGGARPDHLGGLGMEDAGDALQAAMDGKGVALAERFAVADALADGRLELVDHRSLRGGTLYRLTGNVQRLSRPSVRAVLDWLSEDVASRQTEPQAVV